MASVVYHFFQQIKSKDLIKLFKGSHGYKNGEQKEDFIYIEDAIKMTYFLISNQVESGIYNIGTGTSRSFNELAEVFKLLNDKVKIEYINFLKALRIIIRLLHAQKIRK